MGVMDWATTSMAARYQHMTDPIRADIAKRVGGLIWKPAELQPPIRRPTRLGSRMAVRRSPDE